MKPIIFSVFVFIFQTSQCLQASEMDYDFQESVQESICRAMEDNYDEEVVQTLKEGADRNYVECHLLYGEYLLHKKLDYNGAFFYINKAAEEDSSEARALIEATIQGWEEDQEKRKNLFCTRWPEVLKEDLRTLGIHTYTANDIATYLLKLDYDSEEPDTTPLKLEKMLYYAQACSLQARKAPRFFEKVEAWRYGPVVDSVYNQYKEYGKGIIALSINEPVVVIDDQDTLEVLNAVYDVCKEYSPLCLSEITHKEGTPWKQVYHPNMNYEISWHLMLEDQTKPLREIMNILGASGSAHQTKKRKLHNGDE